MLRLIILLVCAAASLAAQQASPYVPLQHWAMPYVEHLIATGVLRDPTPLTRPLRQADLVAALEAVDTVYTGDAAYATVRRLLAEFKPRSRGDRLRIEGDAGVAAATEPLRDPLEIGRGVPARPVGPSHGFVSGGVALQAQLGPVVLVTHPTEDTRLRFDPDWYDTRRNGFRPGEAYLSAQWRYGEVFFGVLDRNWGPSGIQGLLLSDNPYNFDHLAIRVGTPAIQLQAIVAELDSRPIDSTGALANRFMFQHRLYIRPHGRWTVALWEGTVWAGANRQLELWYLNLVNLGWIVQEYSGVGNANNFLGLDWERHGAVTVFGQFMLDDIQIQHQAAADKKPSSYGLTVGAKGGLGADATSWTAFYTRVANLTYRNEDSLQVPLFHLLGTGRNFADYDQATAKLRLLPRAGLLLEPELTLLRQGEGDPRLPHPVVAAYPSTPTLFQGVVERTIRLAVGANWQGHSWSVIANGGVHLIRNDDHVTGAHRTRWVGSLGLNYHLHSEAALP